MDSLETTIKKKLADNLSPVFLEVINESSKHNVPAGSESHFKLVVVSANFEEHTLLARHRTIHDLLAQELAGPIHALSIQALTPTEWQQNNKTSKPTPPCLGGSSRANKQDQGAA